MPNTPANDAPYVRGAIENAATAEFEGYQFVTFPEPFDRETINPVVVNEDGSFLLAFRVSAPAYMNMFSQPASPGGTAVLSAPGGVFGEFVVFNAPAGAGGLVTYALAGRDPGNAPLNVPLTLTEGRVTITEAMLAQFAPGSSPVITVAGLAPGATLSGFGMVEVTRFYDPAGPTETIAALPSSPTVPGSGAMSFIPPQMTSSFAIGNAAAWTGPSTVYRIGISSQEPLDLTGFAGTVNLANAPSQGSFRTLITVSPVDGMISVPETLLEQLQAKPGAISLLVSGATPGATPLVTATAQLPVTTITEGLYVQSFDSSGNPLGEAVRVDDAPSAISNDDPGDRFVMAKGGDGSVVIAWLGNADGDSAPDAVYVRKLDAAGEPQGPVVELTGLSGSALEALADGDVGGGVLTGLADGGFAIAYAVQAEQIFTFISQNVNTSFTFAPVSGQLERVELLSYNAPGALTAQVRGEAPNGAPLSVPVTIVNGVFQMTDAVRSQFAPDAHLTLAVSGFSAGLLTADVITRDIFDFSGPTSISGIARTATAANAPGALPDAFFATGQGQALSYQVDSFTPAAGATVAYTLTLLTAQPINTAGQTLYSGSSIAGLLASTPNTPFNGAFVTTLVVTPVNGLVSVPQDILSQISGDGLRTVLGISGLQAGTSVGVTINVRHPSDIVEPGVFIQTFAPDGSAEGGPQRIDDADGILTATALPDEEQPGVGIHATEDGGFRVTWLGLSADGSDEGRLISRAFDANGNAAGATFDLSGSELPALVEAAESGAELLLPAEAQVLELGNGGFAALFQVAADEAFASFSSLAVAPANGSGTVIFTPLQGQLESLTLDTGNSVGAALAAAPRAGFVTGRGLDGNTLQVPVTIVDGRFEMTDAIRDQFAPGEKLSLGITGVTNPASPSQTSFVFVPAFVTSRDIFTYDETSPVRSFNSLVTASTGGTNNGPDATFGSAIGQTIGFQINGLTPAAGETTEYVLFVTSDTPIDTSGLTLFAGTQSPPIFSSTQNATAVNGLFANSIAVTPVNGRIDVPQALLDQFPNGGFIVTLNIRGLQAGTQVNVDTIVREPASIIEEGVFVQLFDSAGNPTDTVRVDDANSAAASEDYAMASLQSDGEGGFRVVWVSSVDGDEGGAFHIRRFDAAGNAIGEQSNLSSLPDRIYDEGAPVTLYTAGLFADPDPGDTLTFSASGLPDGLTIDPVTGVISGRVGVPGLYAITVKGTDSGGLSASTSFEIFVVEGPADPNRAPTGIAFGNVVAETPENGGQVKVADILVDDDGLGSITLALAGADAGRFSIINGALYFNGGDFERQSEYDVTVLASDPDLPDAPVSRDFELLLTNVVEPQVFRGSTRDDTLTVNPDSADAWTVNASLGNDTISTGAGEDTVNGGGGDDELSTGEGADSVIGAAGEDFILGGGGNDTISGGGEDDNLRGGAGADSITGDGGDDAIQGNDGNDRIAGGSGNDTVFGGGGNDAIEGEAGNDDLRGGSGADELTGGIGNDSLRGDGGDDFIVGGAGADWLAGGAGRDVFAFAATSESRGANVDQIADFDAASDRLDLSLVDANTRAVDDQAFSWIGSAAFGRVAGQLRFEVVGSDTHILGDVNGDGRADFEIVLLNVTGLPASGDFLIP